MAKKIKHRLKAGHTSLPDGMAEALQLAYAGAQLLEQGEAEQAEANWREAVKICPSCSPAWSFLTDFLTSGQRTEEALICLDRLMATSDRSSASLLQLAAKSSDLERYGQARKLLRDAGPLDGDLKRQAALLTAIVDLHEQHWESAVANVSCVLEGEPDHREALNIRAKACHQLGRLAEEMADLRRFLDLYPDSARHSEWLFKLNLLAETTPEVLYEESRRWNELHAAPLAARIKPHENMPDPRRRLRIGYLSPDINNHAIMKVLPPVLEGHDPALFEVFVYSVGAKKDDSTERVRATVKNFVEIRATKEEIAARVRADSIDILIDLAGHSSFSENLLIFALKPAPVQATWIGSMATTGLSTMDYFIGDQHMPCPGTEHLFSETVFRLDRAVSAYRRRADVEIVTPPYFQNGYITFGCLNGKQKITPAVLEVWAVILHLHPGSKLFLKSWGLDHAEVRRGLLDAFANHGIGAERIQLEGRSMPLEYMKAWNKVDIALDPFPYNGGTTTMDALWMGVPVVCIGGRLAVAACGASLLAAVGLPVANTLEQYVGLASLLAKTVPAEPDMRRRLHELMVKSPLRDERGFVAALESAYREMWRRWCERQNARTS